jgi:oligoribonuclease
MRAAKSSRYGGAVGGDMADVANFQPQAYGQGQGEGEEKERVKSESRNGGQAVRKSGFSMESGNYMAGNANNLVWLDMEMTGLNPDGDRIIEMAMVVTNSELEMVAESPAWVVHQSDAILAGMDDWNQKTHGRSGLIDKVKASTMDEAAVEAGAGIPEEIFMAKGHSPMCGNSIGQDRRFMARYMPTLEAFFHYRNLDVST